MHKILTSKHQRVRPTQSLVVHYLTLNQRRAKIKLNSIFSFDYSVYIYHRQALPTRIYNGMSIVLHHQDNLRFFHMDWTLSNLQIQISSIFNRFVFRHLLGLVSSVRFMTEAEKNCCCHQCEPTHFLSFLYCNWIIWQKKQIFFILSEISWRRKKLIYWSYEKILKMNTCLRLLQWYSVLFNYLIMIHCVIISFFACAISYNKQETTQWVFRTSMKMTRNSRFEC